MLKGFRARSTISFCLPGSLCAAFAAIFTSSASAQLDEGDFGNIILVVDELAADDSLGSPGTAHESESDETGIVVPDVEDIQFTDDEEQGRGRDGEHRGGRGGEGRDRGEDEEDGGDREHHRRLGERFGSEWGLEGDGDGHHRRHRFGFGRGFGVRHHFGHDRGMAFGPWSRWGRFGHGFGRWPGDFGPRHHLARWDRFDAWGSRRGDHDSHWGRDGFGWGRNRQHGDDHDGHGRDVERRMAFDFGGRFEGDAPRDREEWERDDEFHEFDRWADWQDRRQGAARDEEAIDEDMNDRDDQSAAGGPRFRGGFGGDRGPAAFGSFSDGRGPGRGFGNPGFGGFRGGRPDLPQFFEDIRRAQERFDRGGESVHGGRDDDSGQRRSDRERDQPVDDSETEDAEVDDV